MQTQSPFLSVQSFLVEEAPIDRQVEDLAPPSSSPFLSLYEFEEGSGPVEPESEELAAFLSELQDEEFDEAIYELAAEANDLYGSQLVNEQGEKSATAYETERVLAQHFEPLASEVEALLEAVEKRWGEREAATIPEGEIDTFLDEYRAQTDLSPSFEFFFKKIGRAIKKVAKKAVNLAKKGVRFVGKFALGPLLKKIKALIRPLLKRVLRFAIGKLPVALQPVAKQLAAKIGVLKELEDEEADSGLAAEASGDATSIQMGFNGQLANLLFASSEVEQDAEVAQVISSAQAPADDTLGELDSARDRFVQQLGQLKDGEDPTPQLEEFIPAILPALKVGIKLIGRKRVVNVLANLLAKLIRKLVGPQHAPALSKAMVDAGLRLINLEVTAQDEARAAGSAVAATVEETVRRVAALPDYVLDSQELFEASALEAFEQAAAANLPVRLPEQIYRKRPGLREAIVIRGTWMLKPLRGRARYKKFSKIAPVRITPQKAQAIQTFGGEPLAEFLEEQLGLEPGEEVEGNVHLFEATPGTMLSEVGRLEETTPGLGSSEAYAQFHPLTPDAAGLLLSEPGLGHEADPRSLANSYNTDIGQRFYYLEIPGKRPLQTPVLGGQARGRRRTRVRLALDFRADQIRVFLYLSEIRAQQIAVKLRQQAHIGQVASFLHGLIERGLRSALAGGFGRLKIIHEAVTPDQWLPALRRLPSLVPQVLLRRLNQWVMQGLLARLKEQTPRFLAAANEPADGVTLVLTISNPPGFPQLRQALKGKAISLAGLKVSDGTPAVSIRIAPGYANE
ncbi:MAG: hypothetical protein OEY86_06595 [Nitrospira sp.]|nr:hypothetical protein [Nitrospira sp.]